MGQPLMNAIIAIGVVVNLWALVDVERIPAERFRQSGVSRGFVELCLGLGLLSFVLGPFPGLFYFAAIRPLIHNRGRLPT